MTPPYYSSFHGSRCIWVYLLLLAISTTQQRTWRPPGGASCLRVSHGSLQRRSFFTNGSYSSRSTSLSARPPVLQHKPHMSETCMQRRWCSSGPGAKDWTSSESSQYYLLGRSPAHVSPQSSLKYRGAIQRGRGERPQERSLSHRCSALITTRIQSHDCDTCAYSSVPATRRLYPPGRSSLVESPPLVDVGWLPSRTAGAAPGPQALTTNLFPSAHITAPAALESVGALLQGDSRQKRVCCGTFATRCGCGSKTSSLSVSEGTNSVAAASRGEHAFCCHLHSSSGAGNKRRNGRAAGPLSDKVQGERYDDSGLAREKRIRKECELFREPQNVVRSRALLCNYLNSVSDVLLPISRYLQNTSERVRPWIAKWVTGEYVADPASSVAQTVVDENCSSGHPLGTEKWRFILQGRRWLGLRARDEEETVEIQFFKDGTAVTEHGITGVWTTTRVGLSLFLFVPCPTESSPLSPEEAHTCTGGATCAREVGETGHRPASEECETGSEVAYDVMHLTAHFYWNAQNRTPYMYRGSVTRDRRSRFVPSFLLRPVVATFYGYGVTDSSENAPQTD